jgi:3-isopropylmalate dehydrogenase
LEKAVQNVLNAGVRTGDIATPGQKTVGTKGMGDAVLAELDKLSI